MNEKSSKKIVSLVLSAILVCLVLMAFMTSNAFAAAKVSKITDNTGATTFYGVFVGVNKPDLKGAEESAKEMHDMLDETNGAPYKGWKAGNKKLLRGGAAKRANINKAINDFKKKAKPGDEFIFSYQGHGSDAIRKDGVKDGEEAEADPKDEPNAYDNSIRISDGRITDDELAKMLSGFNYSVTIVVILDTCYSGTFIDGSKDLKAITQKKDGKDVKPGPGHIEVLMASSGTTNEHAYKWDDKNKNGKVDPDELIGPLKHRTTCQIVWDKNDNNKFDPDIDEIVPPEKVKWKFDFTYQLLKGLAKDGKDKKGVDTTNADTDKDGTTTAKELFNYAKHLYKEWYESDSDNDGTFDEDDVDQVMIDGEVYYLRIDNDGDGWIDEDPSPEYLPTYWESTLPEEVPAIAPIGFLLALIALLGLAAIALRKMNKR